MIKYPFQDKQARMKKYLAACFTASTLVASIMVSVIHKSQN